MATEERKELIDILKTLSGWVANDANTYIWAKHKKDFWLLTEEHGKSKYNLGGVNFFIVLGSLAFISLIAKIYKILRTEKVEELFNEYGDFKNESEAVEEFIYNINSKIKLIDDTKNIKLFWKSIRHGLVHFYFPKNTQIQAFGQKYIDEEYQSYKKKLFNSSKPPIIKKDNLGRFYINADLLASKIQLITKWLIENELKSNSCNVRNIKIIINKIIQ